MKILDARVDWHDGYANDPTLQVLIDKWPTEARTRYVKYQPNSRVNLGVSNQQQQILGDRAGLRLPQAIAAPALDQTDTKVPGLYVSRTAGLVNFFYHEPTNERGYGGRAFHLKMKSGGEVTIVGPWSSRAGVVNRYLEPKYHCLDVSIIADVEGWRRGYTFRAGAITMELAEEAIRLINSQRIANKTPIVRIYPTFDSTDVTYILRYEVPATASYLRSSDELLLSALRYCKDPEEVLAVRITRYMDKHYTSNWREFL